MRILRIYIIIIVILLFASSCKKAILYSSIFLESFYEIFDQSQFNYKYLMVIPTNGCTVCTNYAELFFNDNKDRADIFFIFTKIISKRFLCRKIR